MDSAGLVSFMKEKKDSGDDVQESRKIWEIDKQLGLYADIDEEVIWNLINFRRSSRKRTTPR